MKYLPTAAAKPMESIPLKTLSEFTVFKPLYTNQKPNNKKPIAVTANNVSLPLLFIVSPFDHLNYGLYNPYEAF